MVLVRWKCLYCVPWPTLALRDTPAHITDPIPCFTSHSLLHSCLILLRFQVMDYEKSGAHRELGRCELSTEAMRRLAASPGPANQTLLQPAPGAKPGNCGQLLVRRQLGGRWLVGVATAHASTLSPAFPCLPLASCHACGFLGWSLPHASHSCVQVVSFNVTTPTSFVDFLAGGMELVRRSRHRNRTGDTSRVCAPKWSLGQFAGRPACNVALLDTTPRLRYAANSLHSGGGQGKRRCGASFARLHRALWRRSTGRAATATPANPAARRATRARDGWMFRAR
jgi:hypothetical protein